MVDAAAEEVAKTVCGTQEQSRLPRELPSKEEVDCVRERPPVSESPREVVLPGQERPRQRRSRRANRGKAERKAKSPSHEDGKGTEAQKKAEGNRSHGHERGPGRQRQFRGRFDRGGHPWQLTDWDHALHEISGTLMVENHVKKCMECSPWNKNLLHGPSMQREGFGAAHVGALWGGQPKWGA
ncbi:hypothetical protein GH714_043991 [Hevea brasiliensis]|uniref:Uncharacterized protein n=1 Tax=Hevea brasiliensis TaxID=3981 RepID=A0A6A6K1Z6_HEVBR|nr:hypothetical protein GH714_043991 [Hevea brasiliensis]